MKVDKLSLGASFLGAEGMQHNFVLWPVNARRLETSVYKTFKNNVFARHKSREDQWSRHEVAPVRIQNRRSISIYIRYNTVQLRVSRTSGEKSDAC